MARIITKNRFDMEQDILSIWDLKKDLETFLELYCDRPKPMTEDEVYNYVYGIANTLDLRIERLWDSFCQCFLLDEYATDEAMEARQKVFESNFEQKKGKKK